jgi:hypothetical protein
MLISAPDTLSHFFLVGPRVPPGGAFPQVEQVGTLVIRQRLDAAGTQMDAGDVLVADEPFAGGPVRFEAEIATWKPEPDVVIVGAAPAPAAPSPLNSYGTVTLTRAGSAGPGTAYARAFDWLPRGKGPRLALAGQAAPPLADGSTLNGFDADAFALPRGYSNAFQNGRPLPGAALLGPGDRLDFAPNAGTAQVLTVPAAPLLAAKDAEGAALASPPALVPRVDTVVLDLVAAAFTLIWRTTFVWNDRFATATLEVSSNG